MSDLAPFRVFPVRYGTKIPLISEWQNRATRDSAQIDAWRAEFPGCNWGIRAGEGIGIIDPDTKKAPEWSSGGYGSLIDLEERLAIQWPKFPLVTTPRGHHLYFRYEGDLTSLVPWLDWVDLLADGGRFVVAPGSVVFPEDGGPEVRYELIRGDLREIPYAPSALLDVMRVRRGRYGGSSGRRLEGLERLEPDAYYLRYGFSGHDHGLERNNTCHRVMSRWFARHGPHRELEGFAVARLMWEATVQGSNPFSWEEAKVAVASARRFIGREYAPYLSAARRLFTEGVAS